MRHELRGYTVFANPADYPGRYVVRGWRLVGTSILQDPGPLAVRHTLEEARAALPPGLQRCSRDPNDDPVIVEVWM